MAVDKLVDSTQLDFDLTLIADSIRAKYGMSKDLAFPTDFIHSIQTGTNKEFNDVNFYDYDGTIFDSYTAAEFAALTAMPPNPDHSADDVPLTSQGWNWSLSDAKAYVAKYGKLNIGQMYATTDGKTHIFIHLEEGRTSPILGCCPNGTVDVDWGDGTAHDTLTGTSVSAQQWTLAHNYVQPGDYEIILTCTGAMGFMGSTTNRVFSGLLRAATGADVRNYSYQAAIKRVYCATNVVSLDAASFLYCTGLTSITLPNSITAIGDRAFASCMNLQSITIPSGVTQLTGTFGSCKSLSSVTIPKSVTSITYTTFNDTGKLLSLTIPEGLTRLSANVYQSNSSMLYVTIPDTVTAIEQNVFSGCNSLQFIKMPNSVTSIGANVCSMNYALRSITFSNQLRAIPSGAFYSCQSLCTVVIPESVQSIAAQAFNLCGGVAFYRMLSATPPTLANTNAFSGMASDCVIYVPRGSLEAYRTATNWSTYASRMQEEP